MPVYPREPVSNLERQRAFRARNPGYYGRLHRKQRAQIKARLEAEKAQKQAAQTPEVEPRAVPAPSTPLMLPPPPPDQPILITLPATPEPEPIPRNAPPATHQPKQLPLFD